MALVTGSLTDAGEQQMAGLHARLTFTLNRTTLHGSTIVVNRPIPAQVTADRFSVNLEPTAIGEHYTIAVEWFDPSGRLVQWRTLDRTIQVPDTGGDIGGGGAVIITPDTVAVALDEPTDGSPFWLDAAIGDPNPGTSTGSGDLYRLV